MEMHFHENQGSCVWWSGRKEEPLDLEMISSFQTLLYSIRIILASEVSQNKNYNKKIKDNLWIPSPTHQTSMQDPKSDKSQGGGGGPDPRSPLWVRTCLPESFACYFLLVLPSRTIGGKNDVCSVICEYVNWKKCNDKEISNSLFNYLLKQSLFTEINKKDISVKW